MADLSDRRADQKRRSTALPSVNFAHSREFAIDAERGRDFRRNLGVAEERLYPDYKTLIAEEGNPELKLRVFVSGGGCSGFQYGFTFDEVTNEDDTAMSKDGVTLLIDPMSYQYLVGAEIDYQEGLEGAQFVIKNPNATTTCGCGSSFSA